MQNRLNDLLLRPWIGKDNYLKILKARPDYIEPLLEICKSDLNPQAWRAAWLLRHTLEQNDPRLIRHLDDIASLLRGKADGHQRELLLLFEKSELNQQLSGILFDESSRIWQAVGKKPSTRITAFKSLVRIANRYPELKQELSLLSTDHYTDTLSPGIKKMLFRIIRDSE
jgi:hypothetical protein